jgi:hypothetical protein
MSDKGIKEEAGRRSTREVKERRKTRMEEVGQEMKRRRKSEER